MRVAAVDLGTNTFLLLIADIEEEGSGRIVRPILDMAHIVRLGEKVHENRFFLPQALERARVCLEEFSKHIVRAKVDQVIGAATSAARDSGDGSELLELGRRLGIPIKIIEGSKEAQLTFEGAISGMRGAAKKRLLVVDVGGGSTELVYKEPGTSLKATSFDIGCVRLTEIFLRSDPIDEMEYEKLSSHARSIFSSYGSVRAESVIAVAGTPTTLACVDLGIKFDEKKVEGHVLTSKRLSELSRKLRSVPLEQRKKVTGMEPLRADVIVAGAALLERSLELAGKSEMTVSTRGLRYGIALHHDEF